MQNLQTYKFETVKIKFDENDSTKTPTLTLNTEEKEGQLFTVDIGHNHQLEMVLIPEGTLMMGSPEEEEGRSSDESPQHEVKIAPFFMSKYVITQAQYFEIMQDDPSFFEGKNRPVDKVSWDDANLFCTKLSELTKQKFRLPSEAEWEYACRANTTTPFYYGETLTTDIANYKGKFAYGRGTSGDSILETSDVGIYPPNGFGLYDLHGNIWEWCADTWHDNYHNAPSDGRSWEDKEIEDDRHPRVLRGGSWDDTAYYCRSAVRLWTSPLIKGKLIGFRVVCEN